MAEPAEGTFRPRRFGVVVAVACAALGAGCQSFQAMKHKIAGQHWFSSSYEDPLAESKMAEAQQLYTAGDYKHAEPIFKELADNTGNNATLAEEARFLQAECRRVQGKLPQAVDTYHKLLMDFPTGAHRREACAQMYDIANYWLNEFKDELAKRQGESGVLRWRPSWPNPWDKTRPTFDQEGRALEALDHVHTHDITGPIADKALFWCGYVNFVRGNFNEADHYFSQLVEMHGDSTLRPQAMAYAIQAKNNSTGGAAYDGRKCAEALHLIHVAEATVPELTQNPEMAEKMTRARFAIQYQQAEKDFLTADYYQRTGHPGSAVFYYELTRRRYAGTVYAEMATHRKEYLMARMKEGKPVPGTDPVAIIQAKWKEVFGKKDEGVKTADGKEPAGAESGVVPAGGPVGRDPGALQRNLPGSPGDPARQ